MKQESLVITKVEAYIPLIGRQRGGRRQKRDQDHDHEDQHRRRLRLARSGGSAAGRYRWFSRLELLSDRRLTFVGRRST